MERFSYPGEAFFNVKMIHLEIDTFLHVHCPQKQIEALISCFVLSGSSRYCLVYSIMSSFSYK